MRELSGPLKTAIFAWLALAAGIHLYFAGFGFPEPITMRGFHLLVFVPPLFLLYPARATSPQDRPSIADWLWAAAAACVPAMDWNTRSTGAPRSTAAMVLVMMRAMDGRTWMWSYLLRRRIQMKHQHQHRCRRRHHHHRR